MAEAAGVASLRSMLDQKAPHYNSNQRSYCTDYTLKRYLHARKFDVAKAFNMLTATLAWRKDFDVESISMLKVRGNGETGKVVVRGADREGRPILFLRPGQENSKDDHDGNLKHLVYELERAVACMDELRGVGKMLVILDLQHYSMSNAPPMKTSRATLHILQDHYPERLAKFLIIDAPWLFQGFFKIISPFIDKETAAKLVFVNGKTAEAKREVLSKFVELNRLPKSIYGDLGDEEFFTADEYFRF
ncbi:hypothetical protein GUITHDRAFT_164667 [Guillardia theta CCMP2712]|uniref:CRAL-TRIO domain-containing protein n=2 Tax=Guillardia theta TaxID=55529 RepID=L1IW21_GUITC|nr:hypothetical protein GUITHDRAFT_164667 [Guillardia theta CCMP2712]EKX40436.1 hypothetical protein GUITHDRAFT_164667 [Guillardia theta CCMP2712]|eukprot:XP_005827416.1 hypothetical protein GUITHDRAFT_164667 [Guillardia theta CCMP2712]